MSDSFSYAFYEKVRIRPQDPAKVEVHGEIGAILGKAQGDDGQWSYAVHIYRDGICWSCHEEELESTGQHDVRESFYDGTSVKVRVDEQGRGSLVEE